MAWILQRVDKLSTVPGNRALGYFLRSVRECFPELTLCQSLSASWATALDTVVRPWATDPAPTGTRHGTFRLEHAELQAQTRL